LFGKKSLTLTSMPLYNRGRIRDGLLVALRA